MEINQLEILELLPEEAQDEAQEEEELEPEEAQEEAQEEEEEEPH